MAVARIALVADRKAGILARLAFFFAKRKVGKVPGPLRLVARHPRVLLAYGNFETWIGGANKVEACIKTLASLRAAQMIGCPF